MEEEKYLGDVKVIPSASISHIGVLERSGRYEWGSGERPYQRLRDWQSYVAKLRREGVSDEDIAATSGMTVEQLKDSLVSTSQLREMTTIRKAQATVANVAQAWELKNKGFSNVAIAERMGVTEGTIRNLLKPGADEKAKKTLAIADAFRESVNAKGFIDVGGGVEKYLGVSKTRMDACVALLKDEGYKVYYMKQLQAGTGKMTTIKVLAKPDTVWSEFKEAFKNDPSIVKNIGYFEDYDTGEIRKVEKPTSVKRSRIYVRYGDEVGPDGSTGDDRDGTIQLRPGVEDIDLLGSRYAQVRIAVDDKMYMKGMAMYSDDIPDGYDMVYNVNKPKGTPDSDVFKKMYKKGEDDPFGASTMLKDVDEETGEIVYQKDYVGKDGKRHLSALNIVNDQGSWNDWDRTLPSQFLAKQPTKLAEKQLKLVSDSKRDELDTILAYTNPTVRKKMLEEYAEGCDSDAVHLKGAALPRQASQVLIPIPSLKDNEVYAPNYNDGEKVVLVRFPHAGTFESPELIVNNKNREGNRVIGKSGNKLDAIGINKHVADQLSGADFDGDSVLVIPNNKGDIKVKKPLAALKNFDPKVSYKLPETDPIFTLPDGPEKKKLEAKREREKEINMGTVSNLITDMTLKGATDDEIARAVKHSMVVIDSAKHHLDWRQSEKDNGIQELRNKYQGKGTGKKGGGASTLISRAKSPEVINERKEILSKSKMTPAQLRAYNRGEKVYEETGRTIIKKIDGEWVDTGKKATQNSTKMYETKDARKLSSGTEMEEIYAKHANILKALANEARAAARKTPRLEQNPSAKQVYASEVESLKAKITESEKNRPLERAAQAIAGAMVQAKIRANPMIAEDKDSLKKARNRALQYARDKVGANKKAVQVDITDREWDAIQAGAVSDSMLQTILNNTDMDKVKQRATPRSVTTLSPNIIARAKGMAANGLTQAEIANALGISTSSVSKAIAG